MVKQNAFVTQKASGEAAAIRSDSSLEQTKMVVLQRNALVLQKADTSNKRFGQSSTVLQRVSMLPSMTRPTLEPQALGNHTSKSMKTPKQTLISLFEDDWKDEEDESVLSNNSGCSLNKERVNSPLKDQRQATLGLFSDSRQEHMALNSKRLDEVDPINDSPNSKPNFRLLKMVENPNDQRDMKNSFITKSSGVLSYGGLKTRKEETHVEVVGEDGFGRNKLNLVKSDISPVKAPRIGVIARGTHSGNLPTKSTTSSNLSTYINTRSVSAPVQGVQSICRPVKDSPASSSSDKVGSGCSSLVGKQSAASPGKRICTIRPYGCIQESRNPPKNNRTGSSNNSSAPSKQSVDVIPASSMAEANTWPSSDIQMSSRSTENNVTAVGDPSKTKSSGMDSYTYSRIQSLWDSSKFEDDDLVLQPFQSESSSNNIVLGHISE